MGTAHPTPGGLAVRTTRHKGTEAQRHKEPRQILVAGEVQTVGTISTETLRVLVLLGGPGAEREVSLLSGTAVAEALAGRGHEVRRGDINAQDLSVLDGDDYQVVFPVLHGTFGEDGQLQEILEKRGIRYVGSDAASSRLAMDKYKSKEAFVRAGLETGKAVLIHEPDARDEEISQALKHVGLPCVVKPNCQGSSIGVVMVHDEDAARRAVADTLTTYSDCLVEEFIAGRELTVGILAGDALPVIEVRTGRGFYDYQAKYVDDDTQYLFDTGLSAQQLQAVQEDAERAFATLGCRDYGRVDMILEESGRDCILEVNTIPGFTSHSLVPKAAGQAGMSLGVICERIAGAAMRR